MRNSKRILALVLALILAITLFSSCGKNVDDNEQRETDSQSSLDNDSETTVKTENEPVIIPDFNFYLNAAPDSNSGEYSVYCFKGDPTDAAKNYVSVLQEKYGMTLCDSYEDGTTLGWLLQKDDNENADVDISVNCTGGINWELWISFGSDVELSAAETWDEPIVPIITSPTIPDPDAFFDYKLARNEDFYSEKKDRYILSFKADIDVGSLAMQEYISLLFDEKLKLELAFEEEETILYLKQYHYAFNYTGDTDVPDVIDENNDIQGDLLVYMQRNGQKETSLLTFYFQPDVFEFIDFGDRTTYSPVDYSGNSTNSDFPSNGGSDVKQECDICDGSGKCQTCKGDGYLYSSASDEEDRNCYKCHPNYGKCPYCHGTGKRD